MKPSMREVAGNFINYMLSSWIFPLELQDNVGEGKDFWCLDWWVIEVAKYFFEGEEAYLRYPIARRLEGNNNFKKENILRAAKTKLGAMEEMKTSTTRLLVMETCRGFDTLLATTVKEWANIYVVVQSDYPEVVNKTRDYLRRFPEVEFVGNADQIGGIFYRMITKGFE